MLLVLINFTIISSVSSSDTSSDTHGVPWVVQVNERRRQLGIRVSGFDAPKPVETFRQCGFDSQLMAAIIKAG